MLTHSRTISKESCRSFGETWFMGDVGKPAMGTCNIVVIYRPFIRDIFEYSPEYDKISLVLSFG
jgi:hypothetical protein